MTVNDRAARVATVAVVFALGAVGFALPDSVLVGPCAWLAFLFAVFAGWGSLVIRVLRSDRDTDFGMRVAWGIAAVLAVAGVPLALGILVRPALLGLVAIGAIAFAWHEVTTAKTSAWMAMRDAARFVRANPVVGSMVILLVLLACFHLVAGIATLDRNAYDDDVIYTPLVRRLLDTGNLIEPFSFRRLGAYGGQTVLQAIAATRGSIANVHLLDRGLGEGVFLLLLVGYAREQRTRGLWVGLLALVVILAPPTFINTASYWTGAVLFLALYRSVARGQWILAGVVAAATCSLRQNYSPVVVLFLVFALGFRLRAAARSSTWSAAWRAERRHWLMVIAPAALALLPYLIAAFVSNRTILYPFVLGTGNASIDLSATAPTLTDELAGLVTCAIDTPPFVVVPILFVVIAFVRDTRPTRPLTALFLAGCAGFVLLVHSFLAAGPFHVWRYAFGSTVALLVVVVLELAGIEDDDTADIRLPALGRWLLLTALVLQLLVTRSSLSKVYTDLFDNLREAAVVESTGDPSAARETARYAAMQRAIPTGAPLLVMVDDPAFLDFARNPITNIDVPGFASPGGGLPAFEGASAWRVYLKDRGFDYVAFVRSDVSRYAFRRASWLMRLFTDAEFFVTMGAYSIDAIDSLADLAAQVPVVYDHDGLVVLDLRGPAPVVAPPQHDERWRRDDFIHRLAEREHQLPGWSLLTRGDVRFEDGFGTENFIDEHEAIVPDLNGTPVRGIRRRAHLRVRGATAMQLAFGGHITPERSFTRPRVDVSIDGVLLTSAQVAADGSFAVDTTVRADQLGGGWHDIYIVQSAIAMPFGDVHDFNIARIDRFAWTAR